MPVARRCARRYEEIGLDPALVRMIGDADAYRTVTGFHVTPVLGVIPPDLAAGSQPSRKSPTGSRRRSIFVSIPRTSRQMRAVRRAASGIITKSTGTAADWGATAAMIVNLSRRLRWSLKLDAAKWRERRGIKRAARGARREAGPDPLSSAARCATMLLGEEPVTTSTSPRAIRPTR